MKYLYEILVPTIYGDTLKPISTKHHKVWDSRVQKISGGLTILSPGKGRWLYKGVEYPERVIPVRIMCNPKEMVEIIKITITHYRQKAMMYYVLSNDVRVVHAEDVLAKEKLDKLRCPHCNGRGWKSDDSYSTFECPWCDKGVVKGK